MKVMFVNVIHFRCPQPMTTNNIKPIPHITEHLDFTTEPRFGFCLPHLAVIVIVIVDTDHNTSLMDQKEDIDMVEAETNLDDVFVADP